MTMFTDARLAAPSRSTGRVGLSGLFALWRQRQTLASLDDTMLRDIGVTRAQAEAEAGKPIWDVPATWRY